jgi:hypothetical protein
MKQQCIIKPYTLPYLPLYLPFITWYGGYTLQQLGYFNKEELFLIEKAKIIFEGMGTG